MYYNTPEDSPRYGTNRSPYSGTVLRLQLRNQLHDRPGFSSFLEPFFFSFQKEKKKVTYSFEMKEELKLKKISFKYTTTSLSNCIFFAEYSRFYNFFSNDSIKYPTQRHLTFSPKTPRLEEYEIFQHRRSQSTGHPLHS